MTLRLSFGVQLASREAWASYDSEDNVYSAGDRGRRIIDRYALRPFERILLFPIFSGQYSALPKSFLEACELLKMTSTGAF